MFYPVDINNVGAMSQTLYAKNNPNYNEIEAAQWQAAQVSTISIMNFLGRILIGDSALCHSDPIITDYLLSFCVV